MPPASSRVPRGMSDLSAAVRAKTSIRKRSLEREGDGGGDACGSALNLESEILPRTLLGLPVNANLGAVAYGAAEIIAVACQSSIHVVDGGSMRVEQSLTGHMSDVCALAWTETPTVEGMLKGETTLLASGDITGVVLVWGVSDGAIKLQMLPHSSVGKSASVQALAWVPGLQQLLLGGYNQGSICGWHIVGSNGKKTSPSKSGAKEVTALWHVKSKESIVHMTVDPFHVHGLACSSSNGQVTLLVSDDFFHTAPSIVSSFRVAVDGEGSGLIGLLYAHSSAALLVMVLSREVMLFDTEVQLQLGSYQLRSHTSSMVAASPLSVPETARSPVMCALHSDGSISQWSVAEGEGNLIRLLSNAPSALQSYRSLPTTIAPSKTSVHRLAVSVPGAGLMVLRMPSVSAESSLDADLLGIFHGAPKGGTCMVTWKQLERKNTVAVGTENGEVYILDATLRTMQRLFHVAGEQESIRCIDKVGVHHLALLLQKKIYRGNSVWGWSNRVVTLHVETGEINCVRNPKLRPAVGGPANGEKEGFGLTCSGNGLYGALLIKDSPLVLLNLFPGDRSDPTINFSTASPVAVAAEWSPVVKKQSADASNWIGNPNEESRHSFLLCSTAGGRLEHVAVEGKRAVIKSSQIAELGAATCLARRGSWLTGGESSGTIIVWNFKENALQSFASSRGSVVRLLFCVIDGLPINLLHVLFSEGDHAVYDVVSKKCIGVGPKVLIHSSQQATAFKAVDIGWLQRSPIALCYDGCVRIYDTTLASCNSCINAYSMESSFLFGGKPGGVARVGHTWNVLMSSDPKELSNVLVKDALSGGSHFVIQFFQLLHASIRKWRCRFGEDSGSNVDSLDTSLPGSFGLLQDAKAYRKDVRTRTSVRAAAVGLSPTETEPYRTDGASQKALDRVLDSIVQNAISCGDTEDALRYQLSSFGHKVGDEVKEASTKESALCSSAWKAMALASACGQKKQKETARILSISLLSQGLVSEAVEMLALAGSTSEAVSCLQVSESIYADDQRMVTSARRWKDAIGMALLADAKCSPEHFIPWTEYLSFKGDGETAALTSLNPLNFYKSLHYLLQLKRAEVLGPYIYVLSANGVLEQTAGGFRWHESQRTNLESEELASKNVELAATAYKELLLQCELEDAAESVSKRFLV